MKSYIYIYRKLAIVDKQEEKRNNRKLDQSEMDQTSSHEDYKNKINLKFSSCNLLQIRTSGLKFNKYL